MVSDIRTVDVPIGRTGVTPRQSASVHLPQLVEDWPALTSTFGPVTLEHLTTPDGEWGSDPTRDWPRLVAPQPIPVWPPRGQIENLNKKQSGVTFSRSGNGRNKVRSRKAQAKTP
jgi:hypothetical protein